MPRFVPVEELFKGRHFDREIVVLCVRWYLSYKLSYRDLVAMMSERDVNAAKAFLRKAMEEQRIPAKITLDAYAASHCAVADLKESGELPKRVRVRTRKYLNNAIEQDHRRVKQRLHSMLGLKSFRTAEVVIGGIELAERIKKRQFKISKLGGPTATMPEIWQAALAA